MEFRSLIEQRASQAPTLEAFNRCSLHGIKDAVTRLVELIGREGIFADYTRHDISHVNRLLSIADWLIPPNTFERMTIADCLMTTLAIYFHDLGMVVTRDEFARRNNSGFPEYKEQELFGGPEGQDYKEAVEKMSPDEAERFLYGEFVRRNHAERVRYWVSGKNPKHLGSAEEVSQN